MGMEGSRWAWGGLYGHEHQHASETQMERSPGLWIWSQMRKEMKMTPPLLSALGLRKCSGLFHTHFSCLTSSPRASPKLPYLSCLEFLFF